MEINLDTKLNAIRARQANPTKSPAPPKPIDSATFTGADRLNQALAATPQVRPKEVQRAKELIGDVTYPPPETIRRISVLLAMHLDLDSAPDSD